MKRLLAPIAITAVTMTACTTASPNETTLETVTTTETSTTQTTQQETITKITTAQPLQDVDTETKHEEDISNDAAYTLDPQENTNSMLADLTLVDVRAGTHKNVDRVVFEFEGQGKPGWHTRYVGQAFHMASGHPMDVASDNNLEVMIHGTPMGNPWPDSLMKTGLMGKAAGHIQNITNGGAFEGESQFFISLDEKRPYTVYTMKNPTRLVVDFKN